MASLYKKPIVITDPKSGKRVKAKSKKWWGRFRDERGREARVPLAADKAAAQTMLNELVRKVERKLAGLDDPCERHHKRPLSEHTSDYEKYLTHRGTTEKYVQETLQRVNAVITGCKFQRITDISASRVHGYLADLRAGQKSITTSNHYLRAIKMFSRWLVRDRRTMEDRLAHLSQMNEELGRIRIRRPISMEEFVLLLAAAETGPRIRNVDGPDRAILYITGAYTGYRRNEIGSVTTRSFNFESTPPTLTVEAGYSKHRQTDILPLRQDFAERIRKWIGEKSLRVDEPLFKVANKKTAEMIRKDLKAAREAWIEKGDDEAEQERRLESSFLAFKDERGYVVDFHSLRKTFITNLSRAGVSPKTAQTLARHSDINLTMNTYTMLGVLDQAAAVECLPPIPKTEDTVVSRNGRRLATGTAGPASDFRPDSTSKKVPTVVPTKRKGANIGAIQLAPETYQLAPSCTEKGGESRGADSPVNAKSPEQIGALCHTPKRISSTFSKRRARDSNPQPVARHLISNQTPHHSDTLRGAVHFLSWDGSAVYCNGFPTVGNRPSNSGPDCMAGRGPLRLRVRSFR